MKKLTIVTTVLFQFPSNGKARVNLYQRHRGVPSGKFQFPSNGKARVNEKKSARSCSIWLVFQFPSNGKARVNIFYCLTVSCDSGVFQFPSNGKARVNDFYLFRLRWWWCVVSIPFKRESTCERKSTSSLLPLPVICFNSLQTGKHV